MSKKDTKFGSDLMETLTEVQAHRRGEIYLPVQKLEVASVTQLTSATISASKIEKQISK